ncbi:MAG: hypothetical protein KDA85_00115 [Planctomycetaceae bacterium]|nr:hypothetical protein [Planctomycetaceae bacterium]
MGHAQRGDQSDSFGQFVYSLPLERTTFWTPNHVYFSSTIHNGQVDGQPQFLFTPPQMSKNSLFLQHSSVFDGLGHHSDEFLLGVELWK